MTLRNRVILAAAALSALTAMPAHAAQLEVVSGSRAFTTNLSGTAGQSFTAFNTSLTSIGFQFALANGSTVAQDYTLTIRRGEGLAGDSIFTRTFGVGSGVTSRTLTWVDIALPDVALDLGAVYSAVISGGGGRYAIGLGPNITTAGVPLTGDAYAEGRALFTTSPLQTCTNTTLCDLNFRVTAVPEPMTWAMMTAGLALTGATLRRRRRTVLPA